MMNRNDIEEKNAANGRPVRKNLRSRSMLALFALVSFSALLSPVLIEDKQDLSADPGFPAHDAVGEDAEHTDGGWRDNETLMCAIISAGAVIAMLVVYFGFVRRHE